MAGGIAFSLLAAILVSVGNVTQKHAVSTMPEFSARRSGHLVRTLLFSRLWLLGLVLCTLGLASQIIAFSLAPISVVQSVLNAGIVMLILLSRLRLGERLHRVEWTGLAVVVLALTAMSISLTGATGNIGVGGTGLRVLAAAGPTFVVAVTVAVVFLSRGGTAGYLYGISAGLFYGVANLGTKGASTIVVRDGLWGSIPSILSSAYPYVFLAFSAIGMVIYQTGLQRSRISVVGTMSDVVCSTYVVVVGMVVFGESLPKDTVTLVLRLGGFAGVLLGSVLVAMGQHRVDADTPALSASHLELVPVLASELSAVNGPAVDEGIRGRHAAPLEYPPT